MLVCVAVELPVSDAVLLAVEAGVPVIEPLADAELLALVVTLLLLVPDDVADWLLV